MDSGFSDINYIFALLTVIAGVAIAIVVHMVVRWLKSKADETETQWDDIIIAAIGTPVQVTIVAVSVYISLKYFGILPEKYLWILDGKLISSFYVVMGAWILSTFLHDIIDIYGHMIAEHTEGDWDDRLVELLSLVIKYLVWFAALMVILSIFEINITPFLAGAGIAGLAVALAAQDIISNFFGGAIITIDKPFKIGERVRIDNFYGDIVSIGPRSTRMKTIDNQIVTIPNNKITTSFIMNYAMPDPMVKLTIPVSAAYGSDVEKVKQILLEVAEDAVKNTDFFVTDPKPRVFFVEFGASDLKFIIYVYARAYNIPDEVKDAINCRVNRRFMEERIEIPFQQIDVHMRS